MPMDVPGRDPGMGAMLTGMGPTPPGFAIRVALGHEFARLRQIEDASGRLFADVGIGPFPDEGEDGARLEDASVVLVSGEPAAGFASVGIVDGVAHLWQLSVDPTSSRRGRARALVTAVCSWATSRDYEAVTLTTFRDVPWNGPFYAGMGFRVVADLTPGLAAIRHRETRIGLDALGPRIAMRRNLGPASS
jgi:GNAT superfamily N-acetyltransferase